jgi:CRISPR system Cascade subunit CasB
MGQGDPKPLSPLRFDRLIRSTDPEALTTQMRRALAVVGHRANVAQLAQDLRWWNDATRARWCFDYYGASFAAPDADTSGADRADKADRPEETEA